MLDRLTAVRMSAEESRVRERKDKEEDIYYQFWKRETAERMEEEGGRKVAAGWAETRRMEEEEQKTMVKSGSTFLSIDLGDEEEEGDLGMTRAEEEVKRMRRRLLRGLEKDDMQIVSESDGDVEVDKMDIDPGKAKRGTKDGCIEKAAKHYIAYITNNLRFAHRSQAKVED